MADKKNRLWAEAINDAYQMLNRYVTSSLDRDVSPYDLWHGH